MSVMSSIRGNFKLVAFIIFVCVAIFVLTGIFSGGGNSKAQANDVGEIAGKTFNSQELERERAYQEEDRGASGTDAASRAQLLAQGWQMLVQRGVLDNEYASDGLNVSENEYVYLFTGPYMARKVADSRYLKDSLGRVDTPMIKTWYKEYTAPDTKKRDHVEHANYIAYLRDRVRLERLTGKLIGLLQGGVFISSNEAKVKDRDAQTAVDVSVFGVYYKDMPDDQVKVTDADLKKYYDENKERFRTFAPGVTLRYALFSKAPSALDSLAAKKEVESYKASLKNNDDIFNYAKNASDVPFDTNYQSVDAIFGVDIDALIAAGGKDTVIGPYSVDNCYRIYKVTGALPLPDALYHVRHVLYPVTTPDTNAVRAIANAARAKANKDNFSQLVAESAMDAESKASGGELGWMNNINKPELYAAAKKAGVGNFTVATDRDGVHLLYVMAMSDKKYQTVQISKNVVVSDSTDRVILQQANEFHQALSLANNMDSAAAKIRTAFIQTSSPLTPDAYQLEGVNGGRSIIAWGLRSELNEITPAVMDGEDCYVVAQVTKKNEKGYFDFESVKDDIKPEVIKHLKAEKIKAKVATLKGDFQAMKAAYGPGALAQTIPGVHFSDKEIQFVGAEPFVQGTIFGLKQGETSPVLVGKEGVFIVKVNAITEAKPAQPEMIKSMQSSIAGERRQEFVSKIYQAAVEVADVVDLRFQNEN
jgi:peptidyl-prolyl cis-trans isomerase D